MSAEVSSRLRVCPPEVHQAEGVLSVLLEITIEQAAHALDERAAARGTTVYAAALQILEERAAGHRLDCLDPWGSC
ncbi:hypothetical protein ACR9E3_26565 [Actinomycetospora sp. C-140]